MAELDITETVHYKHSAFETIGSPAVNDEIVLTPKPVYDFFKRIFDFVSALAASIVLLIPMAIICIVIMIKDPGNPFFLHKRLGKDFKEIDVFKFRCMKEGAENIEKTLTPKQQAEYKKEYKLSDDPRLIGYEKPGDGETCFGAKMRRTSIDEIPQILFNILIKGNMSVVGPRPILRSELEENYTPEEQKLLLSVKPGLTGYWQAYARNTVGYVTGKRQEMELYYIRNRSFLFDMKIILKTVTAVLFGRGAI
ncbi:MAG: sugar transferase [Oscillospiraceae bacterium]|nr:sugar transferase [Oscillospiraceae bacterium]